MRIGVPGEITPAADLRTVHFVGLGGAALSGIATIMAQRGISVTGSDNNDTPFLPQLRALGVQPHLSYAAEHVGDPDVVVVTTAAAEDNPEVVEARRRGLTLWPRSAGVASVMADRRVLAVAGTHGKTTTTSLLTVALMAAGADPSYAVGGVLSATGINAHDGGELFVAEADVSDGAFLVYSPAAAIVTNVDADHLDVWGTEEAYRQAFVDFLDRIDPDGFLVACVDDPGAADLAEAARAKGLEVIPVSATAPRGHRCTAERSQMHGREVTDARPRGHESTGGLVLVDPRVKGDRSRARIERADGTHVVDLELRIPGEHYLLDATAALAVGLRLGYDADALAAGLASFTGTQRRMEPKGEAGGVRVIDSYAHHPQEIRGDLQAARAVAGEGRVVVVFQPHLVSRTRLFGAAMGEELGAADEVIVLDVHLAREPADPDVTGALVAEAVPLPAARVRFAPSHDEAIEEALRRVRPGDVLLTLGAGDVTTLGPRLLEALAGGAGGADGERGAGDGQA